MTELPLIISETPVPRATLRPAQGRSPSVAVVYATAAGEVDLLDGGKPMRYSDQFFSRYRTRYEIDMSDHHRTAELKSSPPPARGGAHSFDATLSVDFRVTDPVRIVVLNIRNGLTPVYDYLIKTCRAISRGFDIEDAEGVERALDDHFRTQRVLAQGITIFACAARILPDRAALAFLDERREAIRNAERQAANDIGRVREVQVHNLLEAEKQEGLLRREAAERQAYGNRPLTVEEMFRIQLARNPGNSGELLDKMLELEAGRRQHELEWRREDAAEAERRIDRENQRIALAANTGLLKPNDVSRLLPGSAAPATPEVTARASDIWDEPLHPAAPAPPPADRPAPADPMTGTVLPPAVVPVYLVVDQSIASSPYIDEVNTALTATVAALSRAQGGVADVVRLSVLSYSESVQVGMPLQQVLPQMSTPTLVSGGQAHYAGAFDQLLAMIPRDIEQLKTQSSPVFRPLVFFLAGAAPVDGNAWGESHLRLIDSQTQPYAPQIIAGGVAGMPAGTVAAIASSPQYAFVSTDTDLRYAVRQYFSYVTEQIEARARAVLQGRADAEYRRPEGFRMATDLTTDGKDPHA